MPKDDQANRRYIDLTNVAEDRYKGIIPRFFKWSRDAIVDC